MEIFAHEITRNGFTELNSRQVKITKNLKNVWIHLVGSALEPGIAKTIEFLGEDALILLASASTKIGISRSKDFVLIRSRWTILDADMHSVENTYNILIKERLVVTHVPEAFPVSAQKIIGMTPKDLIHKSGLDAFLWAFWDLLVQEALGQIQTLEQSIRDSEEVFVDGRELGKSEQIRLFNISRSITAIRLSILPLREHLDALFHYEKVDEEKVYSLFINLQSNLDRLANYSSEVRAQVVGVLNSNLALENHEQTLISKRLSAWAAIVAVPTAITGFFGQNIPFIGYGSETGVYISTSMIVIASLTLFLVFRRRKWL